MVHGTAVLGAPEPGHHADPGPGLFGGYPGSASYVHNIKGADLLERAGAARPIRSATGASTTRR